MFAQMFECFISDKIEFYYNVAAIKAQQQFQFPYEQKAMPYLNSSRVGGNFVDILPEYLKK